MSEQPEALRLAEWLDGDYYDDVRVTAAAAELRRLHGEVEECDRLRERMGELLTATAAALRGQPAPLTSHDWSSIPDRTAAVVNALCGAMEYAIELRAEVERLRADAAAEREACAQAALDAPIKTARQDQREACAAAIRARGEP